MATGGQQETVRVQRQGAMGSDELALEERRRVQKLIRNGEESAIPALVEILCNHLATPSHRKEPAAIKAVEGLGRLCNVGESTYYPVAVMGTKLTAEDALVRAVRKGSNRLQCSAADALGRIGTPSVRRYLTERSTDDKSARVRARAKIALRRLDLRGSEALSRPQTTDALRALIEAACEPTDFELKQVERKEQLKEAVVAPNLFEILVSPSHGRTHKVYVKTQSGEGQQLGLVDDRSLVQGLAIHARYIVLYAPCGPAHPKIFEQALKMNSWRLSPESFKKYPFMFSDGSLGIHGDKLCIFETLPVDTLSIDLVRHTVRVLAIVGDELEKRLTPDEDTL